MEPCTFFVHWKTDRIKFLVLSISANKLIGLSEELKVLFCESVSVDVSYSFIYDTKQTEIKQTSHAPERFWLTSAHLTPRTQRQRCQELSYFKSANGLMTHRPSRLPIDHKKVFLISFKSEFLFAKMIPFKEIERNPCKDLHWSGFLSALNGLSASIWYDFLVGFRKM